MKKVGILGSINTDFFTTTDKLPVEGETVQGSTFSVQFGGKGANKAVALSRLGLQTEIFGGVGDDDFSKRCLNNLEKEKVDVRSVKKFRNTMGGVAIVASSNKSNMIVSIPGANKLIDVGYAEKLESHIKLCDLVVADLEVPISVVSHVSEICKQNGVKFVLNPSPVMKMTKKMLKNCDYIVVNEVEIKNLPGYEDDKQILELYNGRLILTMGKLGAYFFDGTNVRRVPAIKTGVLDTTGAGDAFLGGFIYALLNGNECEKCVEMGNVCAGLKISKLGAQTGMPRLSEVHKKIKN